MSWFFKIFLGFIGLTIVLALLFYLWMLWAWTPKKPEPGSYLRETIKEGILGRNFIEGGVAYKIVQESADASARKEYQVIVRRAGYDEDARSILYVEGKPIPQEVKITQKGFIEIYFDGQLQNGENGLNIGVDDDFYRYENITVIDGVIK